MQRRYLQLGAIDCIIDRTCFDAAGATALD
jgi:hypothetical protein